MVILNSFFNLRNLFSILPPSNVKNIKNMLSFIKLLLFAISKDVSTLSPVNNHICILQAIKVLIVSGTPSCNLSSIADVPQNFTFFSIVSNNLSTSFLLFLISLYLFKYKFTSSSLIVFFAIINILRPL